jgi:protein phosphatase
MDVRFSALTDPGLKRNINQDNYGYEAFPAELYTGRLMVVCDGMGGHLSGEVASRIGVDTILEHYYSSTQKDRKEALVQAFAISNRRIYEQGRGSMGTTGVAALLVDNQLYIANVGDSRAYLVRNHQIQQLSRDHSLVWEQVDAGLITPDEARHSGYRNMITRALGHQPDVEVDLFQEQLGLGDVVFLSSDGMHGVIEDAEIANIFNQLPLDRAVRRLIDLANERGGPDNITVVAAQLTNKNGVETSINDVATSTIDATPPPLPVSEPTYEPVEAPVTPVVHQASASQPLERPLSRVGLGLALLALVALLALAVFALRPDWVGLAQPNSPVPSEVIPAVTSSPAFSATPSLGATIGPTIDATNTPPGNP